MKNFDTSDIENEFDETDSLRMAWCVNCDEPVDLDCNGECVVCRENGEPRAIEIVVLEKIPPTSPRSIECPLCGADPGEFCHPGEDGDGYSHAARVEELES